MKSKQYAAVAILAVAAGAFVALNSHVQSEPGNRQAIKLEGAWIAKVPGTPMQWSYTLSPDPSGRRAALFGTIHNPFPLSMVDSNLFPDREFSTPLVGESVLTGPDTEAFTVVWYGMKKGYPFDQVVLIGVDSGQAKFLGPGKAEVTHRLAFYAPDADGDGDGLPDPGKTPALCLPTTSIDTRVPLMPPCSPAR